MYLGSMIRAKASVSPALFQPLDDFRNDLPPRGRKPVGKIGATGFHGRRRGAADDEIGADTAVAEKRVGADLAAGMGALGLAEHVRDLAFRRPAADRRRKERLAA